ncbi:tetratricopeptide repeat protein [Thermoactinomyces mirandus]|uniref:Tetratricopeptide repeat protein n=1 Tax=Thermoactinomyces mirandus TaxID=2756294 RepID=A0A7W1XSP5_9BACL|nr:tetratricopeptide repeat protein [Thermoactinomyces mirandus]MBA4602583.1 tetratricopeptide repeat protein [Thermoactinomyces mirandus]
MLHQQWMDWAQKFLGEIKANYPHCSVTERSELRRRFMEIKKSCNEVLEAWARIEEQLTELAAEHPGLISHDNEIQEEVWLNETSVRQFRQGQGYYGLTMFDEARKIFQQVVDEEPDFLLGRIYFGLTLFHEGELAEANRQFQLVLKTANHDSFTVFASHMLGCIAVKEGEDRQAIRRFSEVISAMPDHADAWFNMGACYYRLEEVHEAIPCFYHALSVNPDDWESMFFLSHCYRAIKEWNSVSFWRLAAYEKTKHPRILESIAHDYEEMGLPDKALEWYHRLLGKDSKYPGAYHGLAWNLWVKGQKKEAFSWLKKGLSLFPHHLELQFAYVWMCMANNERAKAEKAMSVLPDDVSEDPLWMAVRSRLSILTGNLNQATDFAEQLLREKKPSFQAMGHYHKGRTLLEMGELQDAIRHFRRARELVSSWKDPVFFEGVCHLIEGRSDATRSCWNQLMLKKQDR